MITEENFFEFNYNQIDSIEDEYLKNVLLKKYLEEMKTIYKNFPDEVDYSLSIINACYTVELLEESRKSSYLFPGDEVTYYLISKEKKSKNFKQCVASGAVINPGSSYLNQKIFLYNKTQRKSYVSQNFYFEIGTNFSLPEDLQSFENLLMALDNSYDNNDELYSIFCNNHGSIKIKKLSQR